LGGFSAIFFGLTGRGQRRGEEVMTENPFEIPQAVRDVSEQSLKQARAAYEQLMDFMTKTMGAWTDALPANPMAAVFKDVQGRTTHDMAASTNIK
jgi:hypothetical protein